MSLSDWLLICTLAMAWYHVGFVWLVQVVAWPLFAYVGPSEFHAYHWAWWRGIRYVLFIPSGLALAGNIALLFVLPAGAVKSLAAAALALYLLMYFLTAVWFGPQQAKLTDTASPRFGRIIRTHWIRTALVTANAFCMLAALALHLA